MTIYEINNTGAICSNCQKRPATKHVARTPYGDVVATFPLALERQQINRIASLQDTGCTVETECDECRTAIPRDTELDRMLYKWRAAGYIH